ncbi:MAG: DUF1059 domain-containing protein [Candidatus Falkowbacteria bacterium]
MKTLTCKDMGVNCGYVAKGRDDMEAVNTMMVHANKAHANEMKKMRETMDDDAIKERMREKTKDE